MRKEKIQKSLLSSIVFYTLYLVIIGSVLWMSYIIIQSTLDENVENRAFDELHANVKLQVMATNELINQEYARLHSIGAILTSRGKIEWNEIEAIWKVLCEKENITVLGVADMMGNVINYNGEKLGNIGGRDYFVDILQGRAEEKCVFLDTSICSNESEVLCAIPIRFEGKMEGVIFTSKTITSLEDSLITDTHFDGNASMFVVNEEGDVLLVGDEKDRFLLNHNLFEGCNSFVFQEAQKEKLKMNLKNRKSGECIFEQNGKVQYAVYTYSGVEDWIIFSTIDENTAISRYQKNGEIIESSMIFVFALVVISLFISSVFVALHRKKQKELKKERFYQYYLYKKLMNELTFPVFRYHAKDDLIVGNRQFVEVYGHRKVTDFRGNVEKWKTIYPEYNFNGLFSEIENVLRYRKIMIFESVLHLEENKNGWFKTILIPVRVAGEEELVVFGIILDTTQEHKSFEEILEIMGSAPIGLYRFYLKEPFHVEYINEGFLKMLGYNRVEAEEIINRKGNLHNFVEKQDWKKFDVFIEQTIESGKSGTCEYRMVCKDGTSLRVSDTLEVKEGFDGTRYGYGVVIDISKYREAQERNEKKLEKLEIQLNEARIKISIGQMQPHFLYNALASIREVVLENPEYAADLIFDFTTHLRACIKSMASEEMISFSQEIENIKAYVNIEKMRFGDKMKVQYDIQECDFQIVPLSIQPLVENAIRHGLYERGNQWRGIVNICSYRQEDEIIIMIEDNGVGFDVEKIAKEIKCHERDSTGLQNLIFRFENLMKATVNIESVIGTGTKVTVKIPVKGETNSESDYCR